ncbi:efflux RND transporter periplasmic adaptor subunit [Fluoribacter gormanii]|uniref:efflux RND transporter periplasmic adaptor subunit n=1 Tax=Fluoribacter gormanii TaxID=464 RepID=UPI0022430CBC|nr:efflux RND transporter periplasmic adaptor subunit [Fluoribacter gormanii]MCW8469680.1 efflux RND transporter periplasmic adaptor subunit [Fluoribacter gormanii]
MKLPKSGVSFLLLLVFLLGLSLMFWAGQSTHKADEGSQQETWERGPQGGRLFKEGDLALELLIFERGMPPHFRGYLYKNGKIIAPDNAHLTLLLTRFNGKKEKISFIPANHFLESNEVIREPHSFDVRVQLEYSGKQMNWTYASYEGRVQIGAVVLKAAEIQTAVVQSHEIKTQLNVVGKILPNRDTLAPIYARYPGIIKSMAKNLGEEVTKGDVLATVESNESLQNYSITAPITGTVVQKNATNGELTQNTKPIYEVANLANVWADFTLYRKDAPLVKQGMEVIVTGDEGKPKTFSTISYISPLGIEDSQTNLARAILPNEERVWLPGMYINGAIIINKKTVPVAVPLSAIQKMNEKDVVFVQQGDYFEATPVLLGQEDGQWAEVLSGLDAGQRYVSKNSFYIKAELGKEGASHED